MNCEQTKRQLLELLSPWKQEHLLAFWDELNDAQRRLLEADVRGIDLGQVEQIREGPDPADKAAALVDQGTAPLAFRPHGENRIGAEEARARGVEALRAGQVGVVVVAGGQGTRLNFPHPKGMYPIGPVSESSLFQILTEKVVAASRRYSAPVPLYVMTSPITHEETEEFFTAHDRFGLRKEDLHFFPQAMTPCVEKASGKLFLAERHRVAVGPDGHGGMLAAMARSGLLDRMGDRGIRHLFYMQVDNPLVAVACPVFLGYHLLANSEMTTQVVAKRSPTERVGNVVRVADRLHVIEYSDLPSLLAHRRTADGTLWAGSIGVHAFDVAFLKRMIPQAERLPFHRAAKRLAYVGSAGQQVEPEEPNAIKFERFIFDLLPDAANAILVEVDPKRHFAPLKNPPGRKGGDTPETVRAQMVAEHKAWLIGAGAEVADGVDVEIGPLFALDAEELAGRVGPGTRVTRPRHF